MNMTPIAQAVRSQGRGNDTMLVHMTPGEVRGLQDLAKAYGGSLSINPQTGLPEAGFLSSILPTLAGFALNAFAPGLGTAVGSALGATGAAAGTLGTGLLVGGATGLLTGNLGKGLMAGLGAYGGAGLGQGLMQAGRGALLEKAIPVPDFDVGSLREVTQGVAASPLADVAKAGFGAVKSSPMDFLKENKYAAMAAAAPLAYDLLGGDDEEKAAETPRDAEQITYPGMKLGAATEEEIAAQRQAAIDKYGMPYGLQGTSREMSYFPGFTYGQPVTRTVAHGGEIGMAEGGETENKYKFNVETGMFEELKPKTPAEKIAAGKEAEGAGAGGFEPSVTMPGSAPGPTGVTPGHMASKGALSINPEGLGKFEQAALAVVPGSSFFIGQPQLMGLSPAGYMAGRAMNAVMGPQAPAPVTDMSVSGGYGTPDSGQMAADFSSMTGEGSSQQMSVGGLAQAFKAGDMMKNGAYVFTADALAAAGNGSPAAGLEALNRALTAKGAPPAKMIKGKGDGMSDSIPTSIDGRMPARVARDEAYIPPEAVKIVGKAWLDKKMKQARAMAVPERKGEQQRQVNPDKVFA